MTTLRLTLNKAGTHYNVAINIGNKNSPEFITTPLTLTKEEGDSLTFLPNTEVTKDA